MHTKYTFTSQAICLSQLHNAFGTRKRAPPEPKYLVCENFDILYVYLHGCTLNITEYHFYK